MNIFNSELKNAFKRRSVLKVISGIDNTNLAQIIRIAEASKLANATYLDVAANPQLVRHLKSFCDLPICVSSIDPIDMYNCVLSGADLIELGNYDFLYKKGIYISADEVVNLFREIKLLLPNIDICVTIPYYLDMFEQIRLTSKLDFLGVNIIQTEGMSSVSFAESELSIFDKNLYSSPNSFIASLLSTYILSHFTKVPILASSGFKNMTSPVSKFYGASGVGISSSFRQQKTVSSISKYITQTSESLSLLSSKEITNISDIYFSSAFSHTLDNLILNQYKTL